MKTALTENSLIIDDIEFTKFGVNKRIVINNSFSFEATTSPFTYTIPNYNSDHIYIVNLAQTSDTNNTSQVGLPLENSVSNDGVIITNIVGTYYVHEFYMESRK